MHPQVWKPLLYPDHQGRYHCLQPTSMCRAEAFVPPAAMNLGNWVFLKEIPTHTHTKKKFPHPKPQTNITCSRKPSLNNMLFSMWVESPRAFCWLFHHNLALKWHLTINIYLTNITHHNTFKLSVKMSTDYLPFWAVSCLRASTIPHSYSSVQCLAGCLTGQC